MCYKQMSTRKATFQLVAFGSVKYLYVEGEWPLSWPQSPVQVETHTLASDDLLLKESQLI